MELAGIISALAAALPGFIDYLFTVPPDSSAKKRATIHMSLMLSVVTIFTLAFFLRDENPSLTIILLEAAGTVALFAGGWHGGTLVSRNQIGIDIRYAGAGKWK